MKIFLTLITAGMLLLTSCTKEGLGGDAEIHASIKHHNTPIKGATVYVKFNAKEFPGSDVSAYDIYVTGSGAEDHVHIEELKKGDYYLYAMGYDSTISQPVSGGIHVRIKSKTAKEEVTIPVTE